jgi:hypothetical protein
MSWLGLVSHLPRLITESAPPRSENPEILVTVPEVTPRIGSGRVLFGYVQLGTFGVATVIVLVSGQPVVL